MKSRVKSQVTYDTYLVLVFFLFLGDEVVERAAVEVVDDVVRPQLLRGQAGRAAGAAEVWAGHLGAAGRNAGLQAHVQLGR